MSTATDNTTNNQYSMNDVTLNDDGSYTINIDGENVTFDAVPEGTDGANYAPDFVEGAPDIWVVPQA